ncbi:MAG: glutamate--tRNA ligase, partial [Clostridia bacterium]|nr:glutamate--tRNA ligase [Clostridia bacterium]
MDFKKLADLLYKDTHTTPEYYYDKFPKRNLAPGAEVTRIGPSPTGYLHTGHLFGAMIDKFVADKSNGIYYFRLEDTDQVRKINEAGDIAYQMLCKFNTAPQEGYMGDAKPEVGDYGSYVQSKRLDIYDAFAKRLVELGRAFPCFCAQNTGKDSVKERREKQLQELGEIVDHDPCRNLDIADIELNIKMGK